MNDEELGTSLISAQFNFQPVQTQLNLDFCTEALRGKWEKETIFPSLMGLLG